MLKTIGEDWTCNKRWEVYFIMNNDRYFRFEDRGTDFPYYKNGDLLATRTGLAFIASLLLFVFLILGPVRFMQDQEKLVLFLAMMIPTAIALNGRLGTLFKKPSLSDLKLVLLCVLGDFFLLFVIVCITSTINMAFSFDPIATAHNYQLSNLSWLTLAASFLQVIAEELLRITCFLVVLWVAYRYTGDRESSVVTATIGCLVLFGLLHVNTYPNIVYCLLVMGLATFFTLYPYLKTKNVLLCILVHAIYNILVLVIQTSI